MHPHVARIGLLRSQQMLSKLLLSSWQRALAIALVIIDSSHTIAA